jgi:hypothetical protein
MPLHFPASIFLSLCHSAAPVQLISSQPEKILHHCSAKTTKRKEMACFFGFFELFAVTQDFCNRLREFISEQPRAAGEA